MVRIGSYSHWKRIYQNVTWNRKFFGCRRKFRSFFQVDFSLESTSLKHRGNVFQSSPGFVDLILILRFDKNFMIFHSLLTKRVCNNKLQVLHWYIGTTIGVVALLYFPTLGCTKDWSIILQITFTEKPIIEKKISTEPLSEDLKPVGLENHEFENRQNMNIFWIFSHLRPIKITI